MPLTRAGDALDTLTAGLRGLPVDGADWEAVIGLANRTLLTPALFAALVDDGRIDRLPQDVRDYLAFIHDSNRQRNQLLRAQLAEAVAALNDRGIVPVLLKGAIPLFLCEGGRLPSRMMSDLDLAVEAAEEPDARECMRELGYVDVPGDRSMGRPQDAGPLELRPFRPQGAGDPRRVERDGLRVKIPSPQSRALHLIMHDLIKEGDYWRGRIDLRHLHDLALLSGVEGVDWAALRRTVTERSARNAVDTQLLTLHRLFGTAIPADAGGSPLVRLQHWRRIFTARHRLAGAPLRFAAHCLWGLRRVWQQGDLVKRGPRDLGRRTVRAFRELRSKI